MLANEVMRKQYVFPGMKDQTAKTVQEYLGVGLKTTTQTQVNIAHFTVHYSDKMHIIVHNI